MFLLPAFFVCFHSAQLGSNSIRLIRSYQTNLMVDELDAANGHFSIAMNKRNVSTLPRFSDQSHQPAGAHRAPKNTPIFSRRRLQPIYYPKTSYLAILRKILFL